MTRKSSLSSLGWAASVVTIILGVLLLVSPSSVFRLHTVGNSALMGASILALPWAWLGEIYAIPLVWLLLVGWILGLFVAIGVFSKKRAPRRTEAERSYEYYPHKKGPANHRKSHIRTLTAVLPVAMIVLAVSGMSIFLVPPTTSSPGQGHGPGGSAQGNAGGTQGGGTGMDQRVPSIAIDSKNHIHVVWYGRDQVYAGANGRQVKYSMWNGVAWLPWINISPVLGYSGSTYWQEHPVIVIGKNDVLHVLWEGADSGSAGAQQIKHSMSTDGGYTWTNWENIAPVDKS